MSSPTLTLSRHELFFLPVGTPATAAAQRLQIKPRKGEPYSVLFRLVQILPLADNDAWLYFRDERRNDDHICGGGHVCLGCSTCDGDKATPGAIAKQIADSYGLLRYWVSPEGDFGIQLSSYGDIEVATQPNDQDEQRHVSDYIRLDSLRSIHEWSPTQIETFCRSIWTANRSPERHYLHWEHLSSAQSASVRVPASVADREQLLQLLHCVFILQMHHFKDPDAWGGLLAAELPSGSDETPGEQWSNRLRRVLLQILAEPPTRVTRTRDPVLRARRDLWDGVMCRQLPTHHELIEAGCQLREFLAPHLSADEIEALFRVDNKQ